MEVFGRLEGVNDLFAEDTIYHILCKTRFSQGLLHTPRKLPRGRPPNIAAEHAFSKLCDWLDWEGDNELYTLNDLYEQMIRLANVDDDNTDISLLYTKKYLACLLKEHYGDCIYFTPWAGSDDVIRSKYYCELTVQKVR